MAGTRSALHAGCLLVFETRDPLYRGWEAWTPEASRSVRNTAAGQIENWVSLTNVNLPFVSFLHTFRFINSGAVVTSESTLRFRDRAEITASLQASGFTVEEVREAPDRPGRELVFVCRGNSYTHAVT